MGINVISSWDVRFYFTLLDLLYADDTVLPADDKNALQRCLNNFNDYCKQWKLDINTEKKL